MAVMKSYEWLNRAGKPLMTRISEDTYEGYQKLYKRITYKEFLNAMNDYVEEILQEEWVHEKEKTKRIGIWLNDENKRKLEERTKETGESKAEILREALERVLFEYGML